MAADEYSANSLLMKSFHFSKKVNFLENTCQLNSSSFFDNVSKTKCDAITVSASSLQDGSKASWSTQNTLEGPKQISSPFAVLVDEIVQVSVNRPNFLSKDCSF